MSKVRAACKPGAPICVFIDWRQLPALACAMQWAGWIWRGVAVWDKMTSRPQKGRYRQQAEFMVWGSNGPMPLQRKDRLPARCVPARKSCQPHPCDREAAAAYARGSPNLRAGRAHP